MKLTHFKTVVQTQDYKQEMSVTVNYEDGAVQEVINVTYWNFIKNAASHNTDLTEFWLQSGCLDKMLDEHCDWHKLAYDMKHNID